MRQGVDQAKLTPASTTLYTHHAVQCFEGELDDAVDAKGFVHVLKRGSYRRWVIEVDAGNERGVNPLFCLHVDRQEVLRSLQYKGVPVFNLGFVERQGVGGFLDDLVQLLPVLVATHLPRNIVDVLTDNRLIRVLTDDFIQRFISHVIGLEIHPNTLHQHIRLISL
ncbi:hypothetical protein D3C84_593620 [compost metagenome]